MTVIGEIKEINRYPIKSFAGECVDTIKVESYGLYGDRFYAFVDETKKGWNRFVTARDIPEMLSYRVKLNSEEGNNSHVEVTSQDGRSYGWDHGLEKEIQKYTKRKITMIQHTKNYNEEGLMAVDAASVLIITDNTLHKLEELWGKKLDSRRFRANFVIALEDKSFHEKEWIGKRLTVGNAQFQVDSFCERCSMITIDPDTLERDSSLLKKVNEEMNLHFGVYASVKKTGIVNVHDKVFLSDL